MAMRSKLRNNVIKIVIALIVLFVFFKWINVLDAVRYIG